MSFGYCILRVISRVAGSGLGNRGGEIFWWGVIRDVYVCMGVLGIL